MATIFSYEWAEKLQEKAEGKGDDPFFLSIARVTILCIIAFFIDSSALRGTAFALGMLAPLWLPLLLAEVIFISFVDYKRFIFWFSIDRVLLEIQLPPQIQKSPEAIEVILDSLWNAGGETNEYDRIFLGKMRAVWSLEIASNEGKISFYISMPRAWKNITSARIYGQFPEARVEEVEDYVTKVPFSLNTYDLFAMEYEKGDPAALPIKTYKQYDLDKNTDSPETRVDPITHLLELFSSIGKDEYMWLQIILRARKKDEWRGLYFGDTYKESAEKEIKKVIQGSIKRAEEIKQQFPTATKGENQRIENIQYALTKVPFDCGVRSMYVAKKDAFKPQNIGALVNLFVPLRGNTGEFNSLSVANRGLIRYQYPWQDFKDILHTKDKKHLWFWYANRAYFYVPLNQVPTYMNTEELATIWHFPNESIVTPGLQRVPSRTAEAPTNLPI